MNVCWIRRGLLEVRELEMGDEEAVRRSECVPGMRVRNVVEAEWDDCVAEERANGTTTTRREAKMEKESEDGRGRIG